MKSSLNRSSNLMLGFIITSSWLKVTYFLPLIFWDVESPGRTSAKTWLRWKSFPTFNFTWVDLKYL